MANQLRQQIEQISRVKYINPHVIIAAIEYAFLTASKKYYRYVRGEPIPVDERLRKALFLREHGWSERDYDEASQDTLDLIEAIDHEATRHHNEQVQQAKREQAAAAHRANLGRR